MSVDSLLKNFSIVLTHPKIPENIGAAARAACNMGIGGLIVIAPEDPDQEKMLKMATILPRTSYEEWQFIQTLKKPWQISVIS